jgi:mRNA interferase MazF
VVAGRKAPQRGDLVWVSLNPQAGHEQAGRRPALVVSPIEYNERVGLALMCPVTSRVKGYPFEVALPEDLGISGVVLADQVKNLDWRVRQAEHACTVPQSVVAEVLGKLNALLA